MIFEVAPAHIEALSDTDLRTLVGYLAEREAVNAGHSAAAVTYGGHQNAKDGGIDVRVALTGGEITGFVPRLATAYQVKAEDLSVADIKKEMRPKGKLRESIRALGETGGAYIIVSSKGSVSDLRLAGRKAAMADAIADEPSAKSLFSDFYDKRRIASWVNQHPGIIPWVRSRIGQEISGWKPFQDWSSSPDEKSAQYVLDDGVRLVGASQNDNGLKVEEGIRRLRSILNNPKGIVRLVGLSGVGKTRLVQALFDDRIGVSPLDRHLAVYTDMSDNPNPVPTELLSRLQNNGQRCILIVDNCGAELHRKLAARLTADSPISLITVEYDISDDEPENTNVFKLEPASKEVIEKILTRKFPKLAEPEINTIAEFSEGNFRIALALASAAKDGQSLANLKDTDLFNRLFRQKNEDDPALLRAAKVCSLVYSFDVDTAEGHGAELPLLAALAGQSASEFYGYIAELKRRQLVQSRSRWRAMLPHALAHRLAKLALEDIPAGDLNAFIEAAPERLLKSFSRRLGCLHDNAQARRIVSEWLASGGKVSDVGKLTPLGMVILENIAPVHPEGVLKAIHAAATDNSFFDDNPNARELVRLLRSLAYEPALFDEATGLIARFVHSKTESNNMSDAVNVFKSLFYLFLSGSHAPPKQRADFLRKLAASGSENDDNLVLAALDAMLECDHFSSSYGFEFGARKRDYGYRPATWSERWDWHASAFLLAYDLAKTTNLRGRVRSMVAQQFGQLAPLVRLDDLIALADSFASEAGGWPEGWVGVRTALRKARQAKSSESVAKLTALEPKLAPNSLAHRIASYVLPGQWGALDLADVDFDDEKKYEKTRKKIEEVCEGIGAELANDLKALRHHMPELLESTSERVFTVAKEIGKRTFDPAQTWKIIESCVLTPERKGTVYAFPCGFLAGVSERDRALVNQLLDEALTNPEWHPSLPRMHLCVGIDETGSKRLIKAVPLPSLPAWTLHNLALGRSTDDLSSSDFKTLLAAIVAKEDGLDPAIEIFYMRLYSLKSDKKPITDIERDVARTLLTNLPFERNNSREPRRLAEIVRVCLLNPEDAQLARSMCKRLLDAINEYKVSPWDYSEVVAELAGIFPRVVLEEALERECTVDGAIRGLFGSLREHRPCPLRKIPDDQLLAWAHEKPETRFPTLAASIIGWRGPKATQNPDVAPDDDDETAGPKWTPTARRLIREAPDPAAVLNEFLERFRPSGWSGSLADIIASREPLLEALADDPDQRIGDWAKAALPKVREEVEKWRAWESKNDRERDERFDW